MPEDRIERALAQLDRPLPPDPAFGEALFERLLEERGRRPGLVRPRSIRRAHPSARKWLTIAAALTIGALGVALAVVPFRGAGEWIPYDDIGPFGDMPPFRAIVERRISSQLIDYYLGNVADEARLERPSGEVPETRIIRLAVSFDGSERWRIDYLNDSFFIPDKLPPGSFQVFDGQQGFEYYADPGPFAFQEFFQEAHEVGTKFNTFYEGGFDSRSPLADLSWDDLVAQRRPSSGCAEVEDLGMEEVSGRTARHIRCRGSDVWIDVETGLLLRQELEFGENEGLVGGGQLIGMLWGETQEIVELELDPSFPAGTFVFTPPEGALTPKETADVRFAQNFRVGSEVPDFTLPLLGGGDFELASTRGMPTALYIWANWCEPCVGDPLKAFDDFARQRAGELTLVSVAHAADRGETQAFVTDNALTVPVAFDSEGKVLVDTFQGEGIPVLILIDREGGLAGAYLGGLTGNEMREILDAFIKGDTLPSGLTDMESLPG